MKISKKLQKWVDQGLITRKQAEKITQSEQSGRSNLMWKLMFGIAGLLIGLGIILIISSKTEGAICERIKGKLYCWNTPKELYARCRTAIPDQTACHPGEKCYHATNTYGEDVPGNCHWGYFSWNDAQQWCLSKNGRLLSKNEIDLLWEDFKRFDPPWGQNPCYWTSTSRGDGFYWCKGRDKDGAGHGGWTRKDGYFAAGGSLCLIDSKK